ncbi:MAG TPA: WD40 repeat domain-containing protein [Verrucomicrobiae bacterium]|nr:WD40 repeat domain-containing protein [Verrucomicrobiae bacterium]
MSQHFRRWVFLVAVLCLFGCAQPKVDEFGGPVEITLKSPDGPGAGVPVKIVDEAAVAKALGTLALNQEITNSLSEAAYADFFDTLTGPADAVVAKTKANGRLLVKQLGVPHYVVAQQGNRLWVGDAAQVRDHKLPLGPDDMGGKHALDLLVAQPGVLRELTAATMQMVHDGKIDQARAIARCTRSRALMNEIDWEEAAPLLAGAEHALKQKEYDNARQLANRVDDLIPNQTRTKKLLDQVSAEYGGEIRTLTGHKGAVTSIAYSPDGSYVLSGGEDGTLKLWEAGTGREVRTYTGHKAAVTSVAFSPDATMAVSGSNDGTLRLWDIASGRELRATDGLGWKIAAVAFSPDGKFVVTAVDDNRVKLWSVPRLQLVNSLAGHGWRVTSVAFSPTGNSFLSGSEDDSLKLWDASAQQATRTLQAGFAAVTCVAFSPDGQLALSGGKDKLIHVWNLANGRELAQFKGHTQTVRSVAFTRDGRFAVSGSDDGTVKIWDVATKAETRSFEGHAGAVTSVAVSPSGRHVASASADGTIKIWQFPQSIWPRGEEVKN